MEPDEIGVVLARASELHSKISDAIERALKSEFLLSTSGGGRSPKKGDAAAAAAAAAATVENASGPPTSDAGGGYGGKDSARRISESDGHERGDGSAEARSLGAIRDALEVLEDQLDSLQTVQQQQRTEKDSALAQLEESRRILLRRLKDHRGREKEVVHEALAFAGEPVEDRDDLPLPPYPMPLSDSSFVPPRDDQSAPYSGPAAQKYNGSMKQVYFGPDPEEPEEQVPYTGEVEESEEGNEEEGTSFQAEHKRKDGGGVLGIPLGIAKALFGFAYGVTSKVAIVAVSVAAALAVSEVTRRLETTKSCSDFTPKTPLATPPISTARQLPPRRECPPGQKLIMENGYPKCVVKERVELPFYREVKTPDVLYGRG